MKKLILTIGFIAAAFPALAGTTEAITGCATVTGSKFTVRSRPTRRKCVVIASRQPVPRPLAASERQRRGVAPEGVAATAHTATALTAVS
jgi:hypothetical protein